MADAGRIALAVLDGVGCHEDLVLQAARQPRAVAVVALDRAAVPVEAAVIRREKSVVGQVDAGVVDAPARVLREVRIAEARVLGRVRAEAGTHVVHPRPGRAIVLRQPQDDLVAVVGYELEVARRGGKAGAVEVGRALVRGVEQRVVERVVPDERRAAGELLVDVGRLREADGRAGRSEGGRRNRKHEKSPYQCKT